MKPASSLNDIRSSSFSAISASIFEFFRFIGELGGEGEDLGDSGEDGGDITGSTAESLRFWKLLISAVIRIVERYTARHT